MCAHTACHLAYMHCVTVCIHVMVYLCSLLRYTYTADICRYDALQYIYRVCSSVYVYTYICISLCKPLLTFDLLAIRHGSVEERTHWNKKNLHRYYSNPGHLNHITTHNTTLPTESVSVGRELLMCFTPLLL